MNLNRLVDLTLLPYIILAALTADTPSSPDFCRISSTKVTYCTASVTKMTEQFQQLFIASHAFNEFPTLGYALTMPIQLSVLVLQGDAHPKYYCHTWLRVIFPPSLMG